VANVVSICLLFWAFLPLWNVSSRLTVVANAVPKAAKPGPQSQLPKSEHWAPVWADHLAGYGSRPKPWIVDTDLAGPNHAWVARSGSALLRTTDGGKTWLATGIVCDEVRFVDPRIGWVAAYRDDAIRVGRTTNGGASWTWVSSGRFSPSILRPVSDREAWAISRTFDDAGDDAVEEADFLVHTLDGGASWSRVTAPCPVNLRGLFFLDKKHGWAIGDQGRNGVSDKLVILRTGNGGTSFQVAVTRPVKTGWEFPWFIKFRNPLEGWAAVGGDALLHTVDGGRSWTALKPVLAERGEVRLYDCVFPTKADGWAVGWVDVDVKHSIPLALQTRDGGKTWRRSWSRARGTYGGVRQALFADKTHGLLTGFVYSERAGHSQDPIALILRYKP